MNFAEVTGLRTGRVIKWNREKQRGVVRGDDGEVSIRADHYALPTLTRGVDGPTITLEIYPRKDKQVIVEFDDVVYYRHNDIRPDCTDAWCLGEVADAFIIDYEEQIEKARAFSLYQYWRREQIPVVFSLYSKPRNWLSLLQEVSDHTPPRYHGNDALFLVLVAWNWNQEIKKWVNPHMAQKDEVQRFVDEEVSSRGRRFPLETACDTHGILQEEFEVYFLPIITKEVA